MIVAFGVALVVAALLAPMASVRGDRAGTLHSKAGDDAPRKHAERARGALRRFEFSNPHMGTLFRIVLYAEDSGRAADAARAAFDRVAALDERLSDHRPDSEVNGLSRGEPDRAVPVSADLLGVLVRAHEIARITGGVFDFTAGPLVQLWRRARQRSELPRPAAIAAVRTRLGYDKVEVDTAAGTVRLVVSGMQLDFGGIAKGYAADAALAVLRSHGIGRALVAAAGDIAAGEPPPGEVAWRVDVALLDRQERIGLTGMAVSTSGDSEQYVEIAGMRYSHIVDPRSGEALTGRRAVSVTAPDATTSDALATALSVLDHDAGFALIDRFEGTAVLMQRDSGSGVQTWRSAAWSCRSAAQAGEALWRDRAVAPSPTPR
ncbi:MAG: FAD:protein FMN transferase [Vicinamibacteraceae bacterium]